MADDNKLSEEEEKVEDGDKTPKLQGYLDKWTNFIHGWQKRWIVMKDGSISYYKTENEAVSGCRGSINLCKAYIKPHEYDPSRFDIVVSDNSWCFRTDTTAERDKWLEALITSKTEADSGYSSENASLLENTAYNLSANDNSDNPSIIFQKSEELKSKLIQIDSLKETLGNQLDSLEEKIIHSGIESSSLSELKTDLKTCKTTANDITDILRKSIDVVSLQEDSFARCLEQETKKRQQMEELFRNRMVLVKSNSLTETEMFTDECHDVVKSSVEIMDNKQTEQNDANETNSLKYNELKSEIDEITQQQVEYARMGLGKDAWQLFAEEGEMKMYRREEEVKGLAVDPLKACHFVRGFTAHEICEFFFKPEYRYEWEITLETDGMTVLDVVSDDIIVFHQIHKRVWPAAQRDVLFWSHIREVPKAESDDPNVLNSWTVVNHSTEKQSHPPNAGKLIRVYMTVCLFCSTVITNPAKTNVSDLTRDDIACKITYCSVVNPGGWAPSSALRLIYKREYPRFLRKFTAYVLEKTTGEPIRF